MFNAVYTEPIKTKQLLKTGKPLMITQAIFNIIVTWCEDHCWFEHAYLANGQIHIKDLHEAQYETFSSFGAVKTWAGF